MANTTTFQATVPTAATGCGLDVFFKAACDFLASDGGKTVRVCITSAGLEMRLADNLGGAYLYAKLSKVYFNTYDFTEIMYVLVNPTYLAILIGKDSTDELQLSIPAAAAKRTKGGNGGVVTKLRKLVATRGDVTIELGTLLEGEFAAEAAQAHSETKSIAPTVDVGVHAVFPTAALTKEFSSISALGASTIDCVVIKAIQYDNSESKMNVCAFALDHLDSSENGVRVVAWHDYSPWVRESEDADKNIEKKLTTRGLSFEFCKTPPPTKRSKYSVARGMPIEGEFMRRLKATTLIRVVRALKPATALVHKLGATTRFSFPSSDDDQRLAILHTVGKNKMLQLRYVIAAVADD
jgi:hypothetical protein